MSTTQAFKHQVLTCLNKLSDRDTHSSAATQLESIAKTLSHDSIPPFLSSITATHSSDKSPVRKQCIHLITTLSQTHGNILSPHLSKLISSIIRRLRDPDTVVRTACIAATTSLAVHVTKPPFMSVAKPFVDALVTEQDVNAQIGSGLCLAAVVNGAPDPDTGYLTRLLPRVIKLLKSNGFKAKAALLTVVVSIIRVGGGSSPVVVRSLVGLMTEFVAKNDDWAVRKGAAEVLEMLAIVEGDLLVEYKAACLKTFEAKKFDKVKGVRETMNQMIEAWNAVVDAPDSHSSKEEAEIQNPPQTPQITNKRNVPSGSSTRRSSFESTSRKTGPAMFRKLDRKKPNDPKLDTTTGQHIKPRSLKQETKRALFSEISDEKMPESQLLEDVSSSGVARTKPDLNIDSVHQESEDLSLIRNQLVQIETQQSNLFDLLEVKGVRETMNQMIEAWNAVADVPEEVSPPPDSHSPNEEAEIQNPPQTPQITNKRTVPSGSSTSSATRRSSFESTSRKTGPAMFRKLDRKKPNDPKLDTTTGQHIKPTSLKQETKRALFSEISDEKMPESQLLEEDVSSSGVARTKPDLNIDSVHQESEDLSLIRNQLVQIETQQSNLFHLLEKYIGSSQDGMRSLESRVRGLESTLDEISYDLAKSSGPGSKPEPTFCCRLPGADLLSSKLWKKSEIQPSNTRFASSSSSLKNVNRELNTVGFRLDVGGSGLIKNPLAEVPRM